MIALLHGYATGVIAGAWIGPEDFVYKVDSEDIQARGEAVIASHSEDSWPTTCNALTGYPYPPVDSWLQFDFGSEDTSTAQEVLDMFSPPE